MTDVSTLSAIEKTTVGVYVARETPGKDFPDVGIIIEGVVILQDLDNVALATAMLFGLFYCFNMSYLAQLPYTFEVIQKVVMELDPTELSRKSFVPGYEPLLFTFCKRGFKFWFYQVK
uniref:Uncharacterized protein n=1 Tax=Oryzias latipes TaxID=8090 RepID=A0A3B3IPA4_ORYLA